jgi:hypothetical protein
VTSPYSVGGVTYDGTYRVLFESDADATGGVELAINTYLTLDDFFDGITASSQFSDLNVTSPYSVTQVVVASVKVFPGNAAVGRGSSVAFEARVSDDAGAPLTGVLVTWSSSAPDVVSVDRMGLAQALSGGVATVEASFQGVVGMATVVVLPPAGFTIRESNGSTTVRETGSRDSLTLVLDAMPSTDVGMSVTSQDPGEATGSPSTLTFTSSNWSTPQTVVVTGVDDPAVDGDQKVLVRISVAAPPGSAYAEVADQAVEITVLDDDIADFTLAESDGKTSAREGGAPDTITVVLAAQPLSAVVFTVTSDDTTDATVSPVQLTFTPLNWNRLQAVAFTAVDDRVRDGSRVRTVTFAVHDSESTAAFRGLRKSVAATTQDNRKRSD